MVIEYAIPSKMYIIQVKLIYFKQRTLETLLILVRFRPTVKESGATAVKRKSFTPEAKNGRCLSMVYDEDPLTSTDRSRFLDLLA